MFTFFGHTNCEVAPFASSKTASSLVMLEQVHPVSRTARIVIKNPVGVITRISKEGRINLSFKGNILYFILLAISFLTRRVADRGMMAEK